MIGGLGMWELLLILVIVLIIFGANKLPEIGGGMGKAIRNFKKATVEPEEIDVTPKKNNEPAKKDAAKPEAKAEPAAETKDEPKA
jgi:sec-independent protein translocase protein TatA